MDEVRMWMVDTENKKRRATGQVTDLRNGSYKLETTCLWAGSVAKVREKIEGKILQFYGVKLGHLATSVFIK